MDHPVFNAGLELRAAGGDGSRLLTGKFPYESLAVLDAGGKGRKPRKERFRKRAFAYAVEEPTREVHLLLGHSFDKPLASKKAGTLRMRDTDQALTFQAVITPEIQRTSWAQDFLGGFAAGLIVGISPGFSVPDMPGAESTEEEDPSLGDALIRSIFAAVLYELSMVTRPAYHATETSLRAFNPAPAAPAMRHLNRWRL